MAEAVGWVVEGDEDLGIIERDSSAVFMGTVLQGFSHVDSLGVCEKLDCLWRRLWFPCKSVRD